MHSSILRKIFFIVLVILLSPSLKSMAQLMPGNGLPMGVGNNRPMNDSFQNDSTKNKKNAKWKDEKAKIYYTVISSTVKRKIDTALHTFHHYQPTQPWWAKDLGNYFSPADNLFFTPYQAAGPDLGYHIWDLYKWSLDSLRLYNTTRPYSDFRYNLGSKAEQVIDMLHTQNINPTWNVAGRFRNANSPGFFNMQRATAISGSISSNYISKNQRHDMIVGFTYNRFSQDENGGIQGDTLLTSEQYPQRDIIPSHLPSTRNNSRRAAVTNRFRDMDFYVQNGYAWGMRDTLYNEDSTQATPRFTPRFKLKHQLQYHSEKHTYQDANPLASVRPDTNRYAFADSLKFTTSDTVRGIQNWGYLDNKFSLNGYVGKKDNLLEAEAGIGIRYDEFWTSNTNNREELSFLSNYLFGEIKKEAHAEGEWQYGAKAQLFLTGQAVGNFNIEAIAGKDFKGLGSVTAGLQQTLSNAPYAFNSFNTNFYTRSFSFDKTSITRLWGQINVDRIRLYAGIRNYVIGNYLYYDASLTPQQDGNVFSVLQIYGRKQFVYKIFSLDNEVVWQQPTANAPVNIPAIMLRHIFSVEADMFKSALKIATGVEVRYHTPYYGAGYTPYFNQFYYQDSVKIKNPVELTAFFNFKVKSFRFFVMGDQLQQLIWKKNIINFIDYPAQDAMIRFGFSWVLIN